MYKMQLLVFAIESRGSAGKVPIRSRIRSRIDRIRRIQYRILNNFKKCDVLNRPIIFLHIAYAHCTIDYNSMYNVQLVANPHPNSTHPLSVFRYEQDGAFPFSCVLYSSCDRDEPCRDCITGPSIQSLYIIKN